MSYQTPLAERSGNPHRRQLAQAVMACEARVKSTLGARDNAERNARKWPGDASMQARARAAAEAHREALSALRDRQDELRAYDEAAAD